MLQLSDACAGLLINVTEVNATEGPRLVGKVNLSNPSTQAINLVNVTYSLFPNTPVAPLFGLVNCTGTKENAVSIAASKSLACTFSANLTLPFSNWSSIGITANVPSEWLPAPPPLAPPLSTHPLPASSLRAPLHPHPPPAELPRPGHPTALLADTLPS